MNEEAMFVWTDVAEAADPISLEDVKPLACRGCLAVSRPLRPLERATAALYGELVGTAVRQADIYPKFVCNYCHAMLLKFKTFRDKCRSAQATFLNLHSAGILITRDLLQSGITGDPFPNLKWTYPQLLICDSDVQEELYLHELQVTDITQPIKAEPRDHIVNPENVFNNLFVNQNVIKTSSLSSSVEHKFAKPVADSTNAVNVSITNDNKWHDSDVSGEDSDVPDCLAGFKSDIYKKDTKQNFKVEKPIPSITGNKRNPEVIIKNVKKSDTDIDIFKSWVRNLQAKKSDIIKNKAKTDEICATNASTTAGITGDGQIENVIKESCNDDDVELVTDATDVVSLDTDSENNCLDDITDTETTPRKNTLKGQASKNKEKSKSRCTLGEIRRWLEKIKAGKEKECNTKKTKKMKKIEVNKRKIENKCNVKTVQLSKEDQIKQIKARKESKKYKKANYKCEMCYHVYNNKITLENHMTKHELSQGDYNCDVCSVRYPTQRKLNDHKVKAHLFDYICNECGVISKSTTAAVKHSKWHKGVKYRCKICDKSFNYPNSLVGHMHLSHGGTVECSLCHEKFVGKHGLNSHMALSHKDAVGAVCSDCNTQFHNVSALQRHRSVGCDVTRSPCVVCGEGFTTTILLQKHMHQVHTQIYKCDQCYQRFTDKNKYKRHCRVHSNYSIRKQKEQHGAYSHICHICGITVNGAKAKLEYHHRVKHSNERPYQCDYCQKRFALKNLLMMHVIGHMNKIQGNIRCDYCDRRFSLNCNRDRHIKAVHKKLTPFECHLCGKAFNAKSTMLNHVKHSHEGVPWPKRMNRARGWKRRNASLVRQETSLMETDPSGNGEEQSFEGEPSENDFVMTCEEEAAFYEED